MTTQNDFLPFGTAPGANVMTQADYAAAAFVPAGFSSGIAPSAQLNKVWRQSSFVAAALASLIQSRLAVDVLDDGNAAGFLALLAAAVGRRTLTTNLQLYVNGSTGNDANDGLTAGTAWATPQHAWNVIQGSLDLAGHVVTVNHAAGTYAAGIVAAGLVPGQAGPSSIIFKGDSVTPANCLISTAGLCVQVTTGASLRLDGFKLVSSGSSALSAEQGRVDYLNIDFGACAAGHHVHAVTAGLAVAQGDCKITGNASAFLFAAGAGSLIGNGVNNTVTLVGTPAFSLYTVFGGQGGGVSTIGCTFSGSATGVRYQAALNGTINTGTGGSATAIPGNSAGSVLSGGQYA